MERTILHSDLNNFYASVECKLRPELVTIPMAVGGDPEARHGIILAKNQIAKKFGVITGEAIWTAKQKCPGLTIVPANFKLYIEYSKRAREIYKQYTDQVQAFGIDECWLDVTGSRSLFGDGKSIADEIRGRLSKELGITASIGVSFNKIFAKLGSDMQKPDATTVVSVENFKNCVWQLPACELLYVGKSTARKLLSLNIKTIGELANFDINYLYQHLGKWGVVLSRFANGHDESPVAKSTAQELIKSIGNSTTTPHDLCTLSDVKPVVYLLAESVAARLRSNGLKCSTIQIHMRTNKLAVNEMQAGLKSPTYLSSEIARKALEIFERYKFGAPLRSIGVRSCNLTDANAQYQLSLFEDDGLKERYERLEHTIDRIRERYGNSSIRRGLILASEDYKSKSPQEDHTIHPLSFFK